MSVQTAAMAHTMAGRQLAPLTLTDEELLELKAFAGRRKTAQALPLRARIVLACTEGLQNKEVATRPMWSRQRSASGGVVLSGTAWTACVTRPGPEHRARSTMRASKR